MSTTQPGKNRRYDLVVWGASGFTGRLVVDYLAKRYPPGGDLRWAVAGRNEEKLREVLDNIEFHSGKPDIIVADSHDVSAMQTLALCTRVILTTVGPYAKYGNELVAACAENGTHYCDLCGETQWMRQTIDAHQATAEKSGARIVMSCGFDSIPSDIGVLSLHEYAQQVHGEACVEMTLLVRAMKGGASGGTFDSMLNAIEQARGSSAIARILVDPYALNPERERAGPDRGDQDAPVFNDEIQSWTAPFVMARVNTRVVRRSNALLDYRYGREFRYHEATISGPGLKGHIRSFLQSLGLKLFVVASAIPFTRNTVLRRLLPKPGEGPSKTERENGYFNMLLLGRTASGKPVRLRIKGDRDPGYGSTSKMLAESAVCLAKDTLSVGGGCWTPASAMGGLLRDRLTSNAGLSFDPE
jgi:short subunit dehydrogenase-like uncharacterized protein